MSRVDDIKDLPPVFRVDNNDVVVQAARHPQNHTVISLITPSNAWVKTLIITGPAVFGKKLRCGDKAGEPLGGLNDDMKFNSVDLGELSEASTVAIQFIKPKTFGIESNYGTLLLPEALLGHCVVFFWPNDAAGDHWNHFINILRESKTATDAVGGITEGVVKIGVDAQRLLGLFPV